MPNIAIYEGGKAARMNGVSRITTDDGNDGKVTWVPQSERQTGTLYVSQNGTYRAEDEGLHSWSKVTVRLAGAPLGLEIPTLPDPITGAEIPTGEIGLVEPVPPAGLEPIEDEPISADEAESILEDTEFDPSDLDPDSPNYDDAMEAIADALRVDPEDVKIVDPDDAGTVKENQPKVEDKGQKATGTDQETGEPATITPSGKETAERNVPDELRIIVEPTKTSYEDGETISYSGIVCELYKDGKLFGTASFSDLTFPIDVAAYDGSVPSEYTDGNGLNTVLVSMGASYRYVKKSTSSEEYNEYVVYVSQIVGTKNGHPVVLGGNSSGSFFITRYSEDGYTYAKGVGPANLYRPVVFEKGIWEYGWVLDGSTVPIDSPNQYVGIPWPEYLQVPVSTVDPRLAGSSPVWEVGQHQTVPVQWSGSGVTLEDTFEIMVYKNNA